MKKNKMMRAASALLIAVLMTTSVISGTFAKYVTTASGTDSARVAKWGVKVSGWADPTDLFSKTYKDPSDTKLTVEHDSDYLVAPGTKNETGVTFSLTGTPEVAVKVQFVVTGASDGVGGFAADATDVYLKANNADLYKDWTQAPYTSTFNLANDYNPIIFTLKDGATTLKTGTLADIETFLEGKSTEYLAPGTNLTTYLGGSSGTYTLTWEWPIGGNTKEDTLLGQVASGVDVTAYGDNVSTVLDFAISITVEQVD